jgi:transcriptional regulator with XRE-family HTH domain
LRAAQRALGCDAEAEETVEVSLRARREAIGVTALEMAGLAGCPVEMVLRAEFGLHVPHDHAMLARLAAAYGLPANEYLRLALDAAERVVEAP